MRALGGAQVDPPPHAPASVPAPARGGREASAEAPAPSGGLPGASASRVHLPLGRPQHRGRVALGPLKLPKGPAGLGVLPARLRSGRDTVVLGWLGPPEAGAVPGPPRTHSLISRPCRWPPLPMWHCGQCRPAEWSRVPPHSCSSAPSGPRRLAQQRAGAPHRRARPELQPRPAVQSRCARPLSSPAPRQSTRPRAPETLQRHGRAWPGSGGRACGSHRAACVQRL